MIFPNDPVSIHNRKRQVLNESLAEAMETDNVDNTTLEEETLDESEEFVDSFAESMVDTISMKTAMNKRVITKDKVLKIMKELGIKDNDSFLRVMGKKDPSGQFVNLYTLVQMGGQPAKKVLKAIS